MSDETKTDDSVGDSASPPARKLSPLEQIRAKAAAKPSSGDAPATSSEATPSKPLSKLEAIRAAAAAKKAAAPGVTAEPTATAPAERKAPPADSVGGPEAKPKPEKPVPPKPSRPKSTASKSEPTRRAALVGTLKAMFLTWFGAAWTSFTAGCVAAISAGVRFLYPNVLQEPPSVFKIGPPDKFDEGVIYEEWKNKYGVWIGKKDGQIYALRTVCTHLGCTPNWLTSEQKFKCPCHGSGFRMTGINFEGPAPRPLERYFIAVADDGQIMIDKSRKYQQELGQWTEDNGAFVRV